MGNSHHQVEKSPAAKTPVGSSSSIPATASSNPTSKSNADLVTAELQARVERALASTKPALNEMPRSLDDDKFFNVLVVDTKDTSKMWARLFQERLGATFRGAEVRVFTCLWVDMRLSSYSSARKGLECYVDIKLDDRVASFKPHFVLVRCQIQGATPEQDWRNILYGLIYAQVPV